MSVNPASYMQDMVRFTEATLKWCADESETEVTRIYETIQILVSDIARRSNLSAKAMEAVIYLQNELAKNGDEIVNLVTILERFSQDSVEVQTLTTPIIEALQFQDRLRQNLENIGKIVKTWQRLRSPTVYEAQLAMGAEFLKNVTSSEERDVIRAHIPGLPEEKKTEDNAILF